MIRGNAVNQGSGGSRIDFTDASICADARQARDNSLANTNDTPVDRDETMASFRRLFPAMNAMIRSLFAGAASLALFVGAALAAPTVGQRAPDFTLTDIDGQQHTLSAYQGKIVVLEWVNPECPFVVKHYQGSGNIPATQKAAVTEGAVWISINSGHPGAQGDYDAAQVKAWQKKTGAAASAYARDQDGKVGRLYDARHTPTLFIINAEGTLVYAGGIDSINSADVDDIPKATNYVKAAFADLKAGRPVSKATTKAYGCSVKY
jgi:cytochrome oxidase Cu insertion factor (SCO1/SenC/PrrC family)